MDTVFDIIIIGSGPAGVSAALTARQRGKSALIVTTAPEDSPLWKAERVDNYPGFPGASGRELVEAFIAHARAAGAEIMRGRALAVADLGGVFGVSVGADFVQGRAVILAPGLARSKPYPGEEEFLGRGVSYCATCDGMLYRGRRTAVIGLSADAAEEADYLRSIGCEVEFFDAASAKGCAIHGGERVTSLTVSGAEHPVDAVFIFRAGLSPAGLCPGLETEGGRIVTDAAMATNLPGIFAAGDAAGTPYQVAKAVGDGCAAALSACKFIENKSKEE